jgi:polysaccharide biosynthesis PFTS motif protein
MHIGIRVYNNDLRYYAKNRSVDFLIDNKIIKNDDVIFIAEEKLDTIYELLLASHGRHLIYLKRIPQSIDELKLFLSFIIEGCNYTLNPKKIVWYALWKQLLTRYPIKHFVVYNDLTSLQNIRQKAMENSGCETWFYAHSANYAHNFTTDGTIPKMEVHKNLNYDHLILWNHHQMQYYLSQDGSNFKNIHIIGCLWGK